jgi:NADH-quinone oxidoreductase subunit M
MNAPVLWILLPATIGMLLWGLRNPRLTALIGCLVSAALALAAWFLPIDTALTIQGLTFKLADSINILGRSLMLADPDRSWLTLIYGSLAVWFSTAAALQTAHRLIPLGFMVTSLLVAALAVQPFLYAALLIETAVLLSVPLLTPPDGQPGKGLLRFLVYQTLAMSLLLFAGWMLEGIAANPGDLAMVQRAAFLLAIGFALLLGVFPFYTWMPLLPEESSPHIAGFILWIFPCVTLFYGLEYLDTYTWLREAAQLQMVLTATGVLMVVSSGFLAAFQRRLGRLLGLAVIMESGYSLLAFSLGGALGLNTFLLLLVPRLLSLALWSVSLSILDEKLSNPTIQDLRGLGRSQILASAGLVLASLSMAGLPILAEFPGRLAIWDGLAGRSIWIVLLTLLGSLGLCVSAVRTLASLAAAPERTPWQSGEARGPRVFLVLCGLAVFVLGILPQGSFVIWSHLPTIFAHLGQ